jgi:hypothetical protein
MSTSRLPSAFEPTLIWVEVYDQSVYPQEETLVILRLPESESTVANRPLHSECLPLTLLEWAIARYELTAADWTFLYVATRNMELAF